jgi:hypothetical protein
VWCSVVVCLCVVPDSCFGYGAIEQWAEPSVQTPHPMTVYRLFHTVNYREGKEKGQRESGWEMTNIHSQLQIFQLGLRYFVHRVLCTLHVEHSIVSPKSNAWI